MAFSLSTYAHLTIPTRRHIIVVIKVEHQLTKKTKMKNLAYFLLGLLIATMTYAIFIKATDRICDKNWSKEFKQTEQYKGMQCPEK